jgi:hypothetical protein
MGLTRRLTVVGFAAATTTAMFGSIHRVNVRLPLLAQNRHVAMSAMSPLCAQKRTFDLPH